jgi:hypothetical protein
MLSIISTVVAEVAGWYKKEAATSYNMFDDTKNCHLRKVQ